MILFFLIPTFVFASETNGTIDVNNKYAWSENIGWINFACDECNVLITDSEITGYAWNDNYGWINLNPSTSGITNNKGILSGLAWGENIGWVDFSGVSIDSSGYFNGYASGLITGQISFNCSNTNSCSLSDFKVQTDWRSSSTSGGSSFIPSPSIGMGLNNIFIGINKIKSDFIIDTSGKNFLVYINSQINFLIEDDNVHKYNAKIINLDMETGKTKIDFNFGRPVIELDIADSKKIDLNGDGRLDINVKYNELKLNRIDLTFTKLHQINVNNFTSFKNGDLVMDYEHATVYLIENGKKRPILNERVFNENNFSWNNIVKSNDLNNYPTGEMLGQININNLTSFKNGDLVMDYKNPTVYLIENGKKRPILNERVFNEHNFSWDAIIKTNNLNNYPIGEMLGVLLEKKDDLVDINYQFNRNLKVGDKGIDVKKLQEFLNQNDFKLSNTSLGSSGNETEFFGILTKQALIKFQDAYASKILIPVGLDKGTGYFGPSTIKFVNSYCF